MRSLDASGRPYCLLFADLTTSYVALAPSKSLATGFYDPRMSAFAGEAAKDPSGSLWKEGLERIGITHVEFRPAQARRLPDDRSMRLDPLALPGRRQPLFARHGAVATSQPLAAAAAHTLRREPGL